MVDLDSGTPSSAEAAAALRARAGSATPVAKGTATSSSRRTSPGRNARSAEPERPRARPAMSGLSGRRPQ